MHEQQLREGSSHHAGVRLVGVRRSPATFLVAVFVAVFVAVLVAVLALLISISLAIGAQKLALATDRRQA